MTRREKHFTESSINSRLTSYFLISCAKLVALVAMLLFPAQDTIFVASQFTLSFYEPELRHEKSGFQDKSKKDDPGSLSASRPTAILNASIELAKMVFPGATGSIRCPG